ncbi:MAG: SDR family NAD(P)-dependent oxidoreductase, partial [Terriglobia bacterium]
MLLEGKNALVTGGSRGLGRAIALRLAREGARVGINYFTQAQQAESVVAEIESGGGAAMALQADIADDGQVRAMVEQFGGADV